MNKMIKFSCLICFVSIVSCSSQKNEGENKAKKFLSEQIQQFMSNNNRCFSKVIILPGTGCNGCITVAEEFFKDNHDNEDFLFILTNIYSLKTLKHKIGVDFTNLTNVYADEVNKFSQYDESIYPVMINYNCNDQSIDEIKFQKPNSNAFENT